MAQNMIDLFKAARRVSTPLMKVNTPDNANTIHTIQQLYAESSKAETVLLGWDIVRGIFFLNEAGEHAMNELLNGEPAISLQNPVEMLMKATDLPKHSILFMLNIHLYLKESAVLQGICNLRDSFKENRRTLIMLGPDISLPIELAQDVLVLDEPYPDRERLEEIIRRVYEDGSKKEKLPTLKKDTVERCKDALCGLTSFTAEQEAFMSLGKNGFDEDSMWERKRKKVEQRKGATVWRGKENFDSIKGLSNLIHYARLLQNGKRRYGCVLFLDEIEKMFAGIDSTLNPTMPELLGMVLSWMQDHNVTGIMLIGPPGTGKSLFGKALGNEFGLVTIAANIAEMQAGIVGESGDNLRAFLKTVEAVAGGNTVFVVATCNKLRQLPPEFRRRFKSGTFFIDLPTPEELEGAVQFYMKRYGLVDKKLPNMTNWTAAEVEQCCDLASSTGVSMIEAAEFVVPVASAAKDDIAELRQLAVGTFVSASYSGKYRLPKAVNAPATGRREVN